MSVRLGNIMGVPVRIHYTLWLGFIFITWTLASGYMPSQYPGLSTVTYWTIGIGSAVVLFISVLIHELAHSYVAKKNGLPISRITLHFFGGVSEMLEEPRNASLEIRMAAAGPLMSFLIAGVLGGFWYLAQTVNLPIAVTAAAGYGALINAVLGAFNLLPAFPLDGGRVFRGGLWKYSKNLVSATRTATRVSEALSLIMMLGGFVQIFFGNFLNGIWIIFLGWFIKSGAETSLKQTILGQTLTGVTVGAIMTKDVLSVPPEMTVHRLITDYFLVHPHGGYPVMKNGMLLGLVTLTATRAVPKERRDTETVSQAMIPLERAPIFPPAAPAFDTLQAMARDRIGTALVMDGKQLLGIVTRGDLVSAIQTRQELDLPPAQRSVDLLPSTQVRVCIQCGAKISAGIAACPYCNATQPK